MNKKALVLGLLSPLTLHASFIESTLGAAVVNDATAAYYNPAALTLVTQNQFIALGSLVNSRAEFVGQTTQLQTGFTQSGSSNARTYFYLPSLYLGIPINPRVTFGLAMVSNFFNRDVEDSPVLRYVQANNSTRDVDVVSALGLKLTEMVSFGVGFAMSQASLVSKPILTFPNAHIPDAHSVNETNATGIGADVGILVKPRESTLIGLNYRSAVTYQLNGSSTLEGQPPVVSDNYRYPFWTPARAVLSINHYLTRSAGFIATVQHIQWSIFKEVAIEGIAGRRDTNPVILNARVPHYLHDAWMFTVGGHCRFYPEWVLRIAANYNQSPGNSRFQIINGDGFVLGASMGYKLNKHWSIDASYAHSFIQDKNIDIQTRVNLIRGENKGSNDAISLKLIVQ